MKMPQLMQEQYREAKQIIENAQDIKIYSHIDCDGICSGAILSTILDRQNKDHEIEFVNLDVLDDIELTHELTIFSDLGSGQNITTNVSENQKIIILDHHPPLRDIDSIPSIMELTDHTTYAVEDYAIFLQRNLDMMI